MEKLRENIIARILAGDNKSQVARDPKINRQQVYRALTIYKETGGYSKRYGGGRSRTIRTAANIRKVRDKVARNPQRSLRKMAKEANMSATSMRRIAKEDLNLTSRSKVVCQSLTTIQREKRVTRSKSILNWMKSNGGRAIVFTDEKNWSVDPYSNRRNDRYMAVSKEDVDPSVRYVAKNKFPAKAMSFGLVGTDGFVFKPIWIEGNLDSKRYIQMLDEQVLPVLDNHYGVTQDGAPCHTSKATQSFLQQRLGSKGFWSKAMWPPNSPNLNPLDYHVWTRVEAKACAKGHPNITSLKALVDKEWAKISDNSLIIAVKTFRTRILKCIVFEK